MTTEHYYKIKQKAISKTVEKIAKKVGTRVIYDTPTVYKPKEECSRSIFSQNVYCKYVGKVSIVYDVPSLRKWGQVPTEKVYRYSLNKRGYVSLSNY
jgi:hypothetical protein